MTGNRATWACAAAVSLACTAPAFGRDDPVYEVKRGDTLFELARAFFTDSRALAVVRRLNHIARPDHIVAGSALRVPRAQLRDERTYATVEAFSGPVVLTIGSQPIPARTGAHLGEGATLQTGRNAFVTLRLGDGTAISVPSQSDITIARLRRVLLTGSVERDLDVRNGRVHAHVTPMTDPHSSFRVITPISVAAVRGTDFGIDFDAVAQRSAAVVREGKVAVSPGQTAATAPGDLLLTPGFGAISGAHETTRSLRTLPEPKLIDPDKVQTGETLAFAIAPAAGALSYRLQIARDAGCLDLVTEVVSASPDFDLPSVPAGLWFVRVFAIDGNGLEGAPATYSFERRRNTLSAAMSQSGSGRALRYLFKWASSADGTPLFRFRLVRRAGTDIPVVDEVGLKANSLEVGALPPGDYAWQVVSTLFSNGKAIETRTAEQTMHIAGRAASWK